MMVKRLLILLAVPGLALLIAAAGGSGDWPSVAGAGSEDAAAVASRWSARDMAMLVSGFAAGWCLRWLCGWPWATVPRATLAWRVGCRSGAAMTGLAICCTAILLFF